jgi:hypothetical protein
MIVITETIINLKTKQVVSEKIIGPARIDDEAYYRGLASCLVNGNELKQLAKQLQEKVG